MPLRRAGVFLFIIGALLTVLGTCNVLTAVVTTADRMIAQQRAFMGPSQEMPFSPETYKGVVIGVNGVMMIAGLTFFAGGVFVRRGQRGAVIAFIVICSVLLMLAGLTLLGCLLGLAVSPVMAGSAFVILLVPTTLLVLVEIWLIQGLRGIGSAAGMRQQHQTQIWQHQQLQHAYAQGMHSPPGAAAPTSYGYGYGALASPAPAAPQVLPGAPPQVPPSYDSAESPASPALPGGSNAPPRQE